MTNSEATQPRAWDPPTRRPGLKKANPNWWENGYKRNGAQPPKARDRKAYDGRYTAGSVLVAIGVAAWMLAGISAANAQPDSRFDQTDYSGAVGIGGVGGYLILLGVILIAGAQRIDR